MNTPLIAKRMESVTFSGIRRVFEKACKLEAQGRQVIHFSAGRPDFDTPVHIKTAAAKALEQGMVHYTPNPGIPALKEAVAKSICEYKKVDYDPEMEIIMTAGGQEAMYLALLATVDPGDEVLIPDPGFDLFESSVRLVGAVPVALPLHPENGFFPDLTQAEQLLTDKTRVIIVNSPHNPTGIVWSRTQVEAVCTFAKKHNLLVFSDDAYDRLIYDGAFISPAAIPGMKEQTLILGSLSKTYAMTGWRIGYLAAPKEVIEAAVRIQQNLMISLCTFAQVGAVTALEGPQECVDEMIAAYDIRRKIILEGVEQSPGLSCPVVPNGAFYVFVKHHVTDMETIQVTDYILDEFNTAVVPGGGFGSQGEGFFRISYTCPADNCREGMHRISEAMRHLMNR